MAQKKKMKVLKKDGSSEDFNWKKIFRVTKAAGLKADEAKALSARISRWIKKQNQSQITSMEIEAKVIEELQKTNKYAAGLYVWYKKNQITNDGALPKKSQPTPKRPSSKKAPAGSKD